MRRLRQRPRATAWLLDPSVDLRVDNPFARVSPALDVDLSEINLALAEVNGRRSYAAVTGSPNARCGDARPHPLRAHEEVLDTGGLSPGRRWRGERIIGPARHRGRRSRRPEQEQGTDRSSTGPSTGPARRDAFAGEPGRRVALVGRRARAPRGCRAASVHAGHTAPGGPTAGTNRRPSRRAPRGPRPARGTRRDSRRRRACDGWRRVR